MNDHTNHSHGHHITPIPTLLATFLALVVLMALTVASSYWQVNPIANNAMNLGIALVKATLVITVFMGVKYVNRLTRMFALAGFVWLTLMSITFGDYATRKWEPVQGWYTKDRSAEPALQNDARDANKGGVDVGSVR